MASENIRMKELNAFLATFGNVEGIKKYIKKYPEDRKRVLVYFIDRLKRNKWRRK